jgi:cysteine dioxygenase
MTAPPIAAILDLDRYLQRIPLIDLKNWLAESAVTYDVVKPYLRFHPDHYVRNLMHAGPAYQALVLCWHSGQRSPIHDHRGSSCAVKVLRGVATETTFAKTTQGLVYAVGSRELVEGHACATQDDDIHQMSNLQPAGHDLVTLHLYSPPLMTMNMFSILDAKVTQFFDPINDELVSGAGI